MGAHIEDAFVARQPVFNAGNAVYGHELLFRSSRENRYTAVDGDVSSLDVIVHSAVDIGLDLLTGGRPGFINFTRKLLIEAVPLLLPPESIVVEILEDVQPDAEVLSACRKLKEAGYILAMDDFVLNGANALSNPLLDVADIVKVDFAASSPKDRALLGQELTRRGIQALAEKVETNEELQQAKASGYTLFQGYFFCRPVITSAKRLAGNKLIHMQVLADANQPQLDYDKLEATIQQDVSLTYKLLRFINSAWFGLRHHVDSIRHALVWLGPKEVRTWCSLISLRELGNGKPDELFLRALTRAKMTQGAALAAGRKDQAGDMFLMGMFSMIDAMLDAPMQEVLTALPLSQRSSDALLGKGDALYGNTLELVLAYERGDWESFSRACQALGLEESTVPRLYLHALQWASQAMSSVAVAA